MNRIFVVSLFGLTIGSRCFAQWAVFDAANLSQSAANYAKAVEQIAKQGEQISNQVQQIQQMETQLARMGNMADIKAVVGFPEFKLDLNLPTRTGLLFRLSLKNPTAGCLSIIPENFATPLPAVE